MWPNPQFPADLVTFTEEILNRKLHFLWSVKFLIIFFSKVIWLFNIDYIGTNYVRTLKARNFFSDKLEKEFKIITRNVIYYQ